MTAGLQERFPRDRSISVLGLRGSCIAVPQPRLLAQDIFLAPNGVVNSVWESERVKGVTISESFLVIQDHLAVHLATVWGVRSGKTTSSA